LIERIIQDGRPISHVADEAGISRQRLTVWLRRYEMFGDAGLEDRSSRPARSPNQTSEDLEDRIEVLRRTTKFGPDRISGQLAMEGVSVSPATVHRVLVRRGLNRLSTIDPPTGEDARQVKRYEHDAPVGPRSSGHRMSTTSRASNSGMACAIATRLSTVGWVRSFSHLATVCCLTPTASASAACESPAALRASLMRVPVTPSLVPLTGWMLSQLSVVL
jgi:transposase